MKKVSTIKNSFVKKSVSMLMTAAVLFSFGTSAFAFNDTSELSSEYQDAISKLSALEVVGGYEDGSYKPEANITRAEFAKIASVLSGMKDGGEYLQNTPSRFKDVKTSEWYTGWINVASSKGIINGYPDGTFKPNQVISQQEVVTVLMRILGYTDNLAGPWPIDYINQATKLDVLEDITFNGPSQANRGDVAVMGSAILNSKMVNWNKDTDDFKEKEATLLEENFKGSSVKNEQVNGVNLKNADKKQLTISIGKETYTIDETTLFSAGFGVADIKDHMVDVIYTKDSKGVKVAKFVEVTSTLATPEKVKLESGNKKVKLDDKSYPIASGVEVDTDIKTEGANLFYKAFINNDGEVYKVMPDEADTEFANTGVVKEVKTNKDISFFSGKLSMKNSDAVIIKNGKVVDLDAIQKYDVLKYNSDNSIIIVESLRSGKLERTYGPNKAVTIDGVKYPSYNNAFDNDDDTTQTLNDYVNTTVKYAVTTKGNIQTIIVGDVAESANMYGVILNYTLSGGAYPDDVEAVTVFTQEGKTVKYNVKDNKVFTKGDVFPGKFIKFRLNADGVIEKSLKTNAVENPIDTADVKDGRIVLNSIKYLVYDDVLAFNIKQDDGKTTAELVTAKEILADDISTTSINEKVPGIQFVLDGSKLDVLVMSQFNSIASDKYGFVKDFGYDNGEFTNTILFYGNDKEYELDETGVTPTEKGFFKYTVSGDTVKLEAAGAASFDGEVKNMDNDLFSLTDGKQFITNDDTMIARIELDANKKVDVIDTDVEINEGDKVYVKMNTATDKTDEALYVIILE